MQHAKITRTQHPVGHGGFDSALISTVEGSPDGLRSANERPVTSFSYVYDCGSERSDAFNSELSLYRAASGGKTDVLFVSHLHATSTASIVCRQWRQRRRSFFPIWTSSSACFSFFPISTAVRPPDLHSNTLRTLSRGDSGEGQSGSSSFSRAGPTISLRPVAQNPTVRSTIRPLNAEYDLMMLRPKACRQTDWRPTCGRPTGRSLKSSLLRIRQHERHKAARSWLHPERISSWSGKPLQATHGAGAIGFRGNDEAKLSKSLLEQLRSVHSTKQLVEIYNRHFAGGHNAISMSLYSGPLSRRSVASLSLTEPPRRWRSSREESPCARFFWSDGGLGWLGTGDAALRQEKWRQPWRTFFEGFDDRIAIMTLPHHGSANNFHPDILVFRGLLFALATTLEARNRVSRLRETLGAVELLGLRTRVVNDERLTRFSVTCERSMA